MVYRQPNHVISETGPNTPHSWWKTLGKAIQRLKVQQQFIKQNSRNTILDQI